MKFFIWHDSGAVVAYAKFRSEMISYIGFILIPNFIAFELRWKNRSWNGSLCHDVNEEMNAILTHRPLGAPNKVLDNQFQNYFQRLMARASVEKPPPNECLRTLLMKSHHCSSSGLVPSGNKPLPEPKLAQSSGQDLRLLSVTQVLPRRQGSNR